MERATFDIERGSIMRSTASRLKAAGRKDTTVAQFQPARLFVRCSFCNTTVSSATSGLNNTKRKGNVRGLATIYTFIDCDHTLIAFAWYRQRHVHPHPDDPARGHQKQRLTRM